MVVKEATVTVMVGKSAFVMNSYIINPYDHIKRNNLPINFHVRWYSLEVDAISVLSKMLAWKIYSDERILTSPSVILSKHKTNKIPPYIEEKVESLEGYFDDMLEHVTIIDKPMTPDQIKQDVLDFAESRGDFYTDENGIKRYRPQDRNEYVVIVTDTLGNLKLQANGARVDKKGTIDIHSSYSRDVYRNLLGYCVVNVAHSNRAISGMDRARFGEIFPKKDDVKYTSQPANDANLVMALFNPRDYMNENNTLGNFMGYKIARMKDRFRTIGVLKNRDGLSNKRVGLLFIGECGYFTEIKKGELMSDKDYLSIENLGISELSKAGSG